MKFKFAAIAAAVLLSQSAMAQQQQQPQQQQQGCPTVDAIAMAGMTMAIPFSQQQPDQQQPDQQQQKYKQQQQGSWLGVNPNDTFGTNTNWSFFAGPVMAQSQEGAITAVNSQLSTLMLFMGPIHQGSDDQQGQPDQQGQQGQQQDKVACLYISLGQGGQDGQQGQQEKLSKQGQQDDQQQQQGMFGVAISPPIDLQSPDLLKAMMQRVKRK